MTLKSGDERSDVNFQLRLIPTSRVSGRAVGPDGPLGNLGIRLVVPGDGVVSESVFDVATAITKPDGTFAFFGVPPGQFLLKAQKQPRPEIPAEALAGNPAAAALFGPGAGPAGPKVAMYAAAPIPVSAGDTDGIVLQLSLGFRVSGRVEFESATGQPAPSAAQIQSITFSLAPQDGRMPNIIMMASPDRANAQGEFQTKGNEPGRLLPERDRWRPVAVLKSATIGGRDVLDAPIELRDADITGVVVTFTDKVGQVTGSVRSPGQSDLSETSIVLFPADYRTWIENGMNSRRSRTVRATKPGAFTIPNVPAGDYMIVAIDQSAPSGSAGPRQRGITVARGHAGERGRGSCDGQSRQDAGGSVMKTTIRILDVRSRRVFHVRCVQGTARDARTTPAPVKGTSELSVVVSTDEPVSRPLRRVSVTVQAGEIDVPNIGVTDDQGRVVLRILRPATIC